MFLYPRVLIVSIGLAVTLACTNGRHSASGFRLPADGDIQRGQVAFVEKQCNTCHEVSGVDLPKPTAQPAVPVVLGGEVSWTVTDGYLVTSIINPSHALARYPKEQITAEGRSRMPHYRENLTARELTDLVAFLQSRYTQVKVPIAHTAY